MKKLLPLLLVLAFAGFGHRAPAPQPSATPTPVVTRTPGPAPTPSVVPSPMPSPTGVPDKVITLKCDSSCSTSQLAELPAIEAAMNRTLLSACFSNYFASATRIDNNNGLTAAQIVAKLRIPTTLTLNYYWSRWSKALGYESADDFSVIHFNAAKMGGWSACEKASVGAHEFSHTKNFFHNGNSAAPNYYTVPYTVNHAFDSKSVDPAYGGCCQ
jgi:hypothetical protein